MGPYEHSNYFLIQSVFHAQRYNWMAILVNTNRERDAAGGNCQMDTATLTQILIKEISEYAGEMLNAQSYLTRSADNLVLAVISVDNKHNEYSGDAGLIARIDG